MKLPLKNFIKHFVFLNIITRILSQSCNLNLLNKDWEDEWGLILIRNYRNYYELLRSQAVPVNSKIYLVCNRFNPTPVVCTPLNVFDTNLPSSNKCTELQSLIPIRYSVPTLYCPYQLFKVGFLVQMYPDPPHFVKTYEVCFDPTHLRAVFTINEAYPIGVRRPADLKFKPGKLFPGAYFSSFSRVSTFRRFQQLLGTNQKYMDSSNVDHIIDRGHLTPSGDFTLTNLKRSTFKMVNVIAQFKTIDNGNWKLIENWARDTTRAPTHVCTGVIDCNLDSLNVDCVVQLKNAQGKWTPMFLADDRKIPIPLWIYKIVTGFKTSVVFLTLNNIYHQGRVNIPERMCKQIPCPLQLSQKVQEGLTYCCSHDEFIANNVPYLKGVC